MNACEVLLYPEAVRDIERLDGSRRRLVFKALDRVRTNPLPCERGGYGRPLGNKGGANLTGFMKVKLRGSGIRIVYRLVEIEGKMAVVVVGSREDEEAYRTAARRAEDFEVWLEDTLHASRS